MKQRGKKEKKKRIKSNEAKTRELWDSVKSPNIRFIGVPKEEDKNSD